MCSDSDFPPYDPPISEQQREALAMLRRVDEYETRVRHRRDTLLSAGYAADVADTLARFYWGSPDSAA